LPGEVDKSVRGTFAGDSRWKSGCDTKGSVAWLDDSTFVSSSLSSESSFHPNSSEASEIILALAVFGGDMKLRGGLSMNRRSV
jgi:hypothetical protein